MWVRVPIGWHQYAGPGPEFKLEPEIFSLADFVVTNALMLATAGIGQWIYLSNKHREERSTAAHKKKAGNRAGG